MENFDWTQFTRKIPVKASLKSLYDAWTIPSEIEKWFLSDATFFTDNNNELPKSQSIQAGYSYKWKWFLWDGTETGKVNKTNGKDHLQFTFAGDCMVDIMLESFEEGTIVSLTQSKIPTDNKSKQDIRLGCNQGWSFYMVNLKSVYEGGLDLRNKDPKLKPMINS